MKNFYQILSVNPDATISEIKSAFRQLAKRKHPDLNLDNPQANEEFKEILEAYKVLSDPYEREKYDSLLKNKPKAEQHFQTEQNIDDIYADVLSVLNELKGYKRVAINSAIYGCVWLIVGFGVTIGTMVAAKQSGGGKYLVMHGAIIYGFFAAVSGFWKAFKISNAIKNIEKELWDHI